MTSQVVEPATLYLIMVSVTIAPPHDDGNISIFSVMLEELEEAVIAGADGIPVTYS